MIPLFDHSDIVKRWAEPRLNTVIAEPAYGMGLVNRAGQLCTAAIYNAYEARNVELTYVGTLLPGIARMVFSYAFNHLECLRISVTVPADHVEHLDQAQRWGWVIEGRKRNYYGEGQDAVILGMLREECWILRHGS